MIRALPCSLPWLLLLSCIDKGGGAEDRTPPGDGGTATTIDGGTFSATDGGSTTPTDGGSTTPTDLPDIPTYACPGPPEGATVFHTGTVRADQYYVAEPGEWAGWIVSATGISQVASESCKDTYYRSQFAQYVKDPAKAGPDDYSFDLLLTVPSLDLSGLLGEHGDGGAHVYRPDGSADRLKINWNDGQHRFVYALPNGLTRSTVCVGTVSPDYVYLTVLWDPTETGPYRYNEHTAVDGPIWFDVELWLTDKDPKYGGRRSCFMTAWEDVDIKTIFGGYDWPGREG